MLHRIGLLALLLAILSPAGAGAEPPLAQYATGQLQNLAVHEAPKPLADARFRDGEGNETGFDAFRGKVVLVNLWATWCAPCRHEMPSISRLQAARGGDDFQVAAISVDRGGAETSLAFLQEVGADNLPLYIDPTTRIGRALGAYGLPVTILLDRQGQEVARLVGPAEWDSPEALALIDALIAEQGS
jgi:thiol-disulfide isomerase/thioredoxin